MAVADSRSTDSQCSELRSDRNEAIGGSVANFALVIVRLRLNTKINIYENKIDLPAK